MFGALAKLVLAATATLKAQAPGCDRTATVVLGDTCNDISAKFNVSTYQLAQVNKGIINEFCTNLYPGEVICLGFTGQDCKTTHVVQSGDTCDEIAKEYSIPVSTLHANNPNVWDNCLNLYQGLVLCVSDTIYVHST